MAFFHSRNGAGELLARYSFVEPLLEGRRVLEIGAARATEGASAMFLAERGAAAVLSVEPSEADLVEARRAGHHPFVQFQAMRPQELRAGAFDLILLADGSPLASSRTELAGLRRLLVPGGRLVTAIPAGGVGLPDLAGEPYAGSPPAYETFVNALADQFALVEVAAQTATVGWVFGLAAEDEPQIAMDGTLAGTPDTTAYVVIAGEEPSGLTGFTVVALPVAPLAEAQRERKALAAGELESVRARAALAEAAEKARSEELARERVRLAELAASLTAAEVNRERAQAESVAERERLRGDGAEALELSQAKGREELERVRAEAASQLEAVRAALEAEREASRAALEAERESARRELESASAQLEALRQEREEALRARDAAVQEVGEAVAERLRVAEALSLRESERDATARERDEVLAREVEARRSREVALAESTALSELLARAESAGGETARERDDALAARKALAEEAGELRMALDEARLSRGALEAELLMARNDAVRVAGRFQELEAAAADTARQRVLLEEQGREAAQELEGLRARLGALTEESQQERARTQELQGELEQAQALGASRARELEEARLILARGEEERTRTEAALAERESILLDERAALQAARSEVQASRAALEAALERATRAEARNSDLEDALESAPTPEHLARLSELEAIVGRVPALEAAAGRLPELEEQAARVPGLEREAARVIELERVAARLPELEEAAERARSLEEATSRLPALEATVARLREESAGRGSALEAATARIRELEETASRVMAVEAAAAAVREELERARAEREVQHAADDVELEAVRRQAAGSEEQARRASDAEARRDEMARALEELRETSEQRVAESRRAAYEASARAEEAHKAVEEARRELETVQAGAVGAADTAREWAQVREVLEARVAELEARLEVEAERGGILSAQAAEARAQLESLSEAHRVAAQAAEVARAVEPEEMVRRKDEVAAIQEGHERQLLDAKNLAESAEAEAAGLAAELQAVRWEKEELEGRLTALKAAEGAPGAGGRYPAGLRDQLATRMAELAISRREVARLEEVVSTLSVRTEVQPVAGLSELEERLAEAERRAGEAESALGAARAAALGDHAEQQRRSAQERDSMAAQVVDRDGKIARLQREVADKTERLGRLAKELGELKAKGLGKIFR